MALLVSFQGTVWEGPIISTEYRPKQILTVKWGVRSIKLERRSNEGVAGTNWLIKVALGIY